MSRIVNYTTVDRIISKLYRDLGIDDMPESDLIEWIGEALGFMEVINLKEEAVAFIEIENHQGDLPNGLLTIIQVARNNSWTKKEKTLCPANIITDCTNEEIIKESNCNCREQLDYVVLDCQGKLIGDYEVAYYRSYFDLQYEYSPWINSNIYRQQYTPVRLANHSFFNSIVCQEDDKLYHSCKDEYTIVENKIRTSFKEGSIAIAYYRQKIDTTSGYPMIPDDSSVIEAISQYVTWKYMRRMWMMGREGYGDKMKESEQQWIWYLNQSNNKFFLPHGVDDFQNFTETRHQLIPARNRYYGYFGKLGRQDNKKPGIVYGSK